MIRKLKLAIAALLGFSAACSASKPPVAADPEKADARPIDSAHYRQPIRVMYGVRRPPQPELLPEDTTRQSTATPPQTPPPTQQQKE